MDKRDFKKMALLGIACGVCVTTHVQAEVVTTSDVNLAHNQCGKNRCDSRPANSPHEQPDSLLGESGKLMQDMTHKADGNANASANTKMTESELMTRLNDEGKNTFQSLSPEGKALALKLANQDCKGKNDCKGLNVCNTANNSCSGQGGCKGTTPGPFKDKNDAVKVAAKKMAEKRANANAK